MNEASKRTSKEMGCHEIAPPNIGFVYYLLEVRPSVINLLGKGPTNVFLVMEE